MLYALAEEDREISPGIKMTTTKAADSLKFDKFADSS